MHKGVLWLISTAAAACLLLLAVVPEKFWHNGPTVCVWKNIFDVECLGCGATRALSTALHGHWAEAMQLNPLALLVVLPLLGAAAAAAPLTRAAGLPRDRVERP